MCVCGGVGYLCGGWGVCVCVCVCVGGGVCNDTLRAFATSRVNPSNSLSISSSLNFES